MKAFFFSSVFAVFKFLVEPTGINLQPELSCQNSVFYLFFGATAMQLVVM